MRYQYINFGHDAGSRAALDNRVPGGDPVDVI